MAFINAKDVQAIRQELKVAFPAMKFSVRKQHYSQVAVTLLQGDIAFNDLYRTDAYGKDNYVQINQFHTNMYGEHKAFCDNVLDIIKTAPARGEGFHKGRGWFDESDSQSDYFHTAFYISFNIGAWDKPYLLTPEGQRKSLKIKLPKATKEVETLEQLVGADMATKLRELGMIKEIA